VKTRSRAAFALVACAAVVFAGCSDDSSDSGDAPETNEAEQTTTTAAPEPLRILVTNDDGIGAEGIDELVEGLRGLPDVEVTVVAPATNQSGSGGKVTGGTLTASDATTASGYEATAVEGFPADTIVWALDQGGIESPPDLVVSGINEGQNLGPITNISGTVGAARAAATRGIPALALSQGLGAAIDYEHAVELALEWVEEWRASESSAPEVESINVPTCGTGEVRELLELPVATDAGERSVLSADVDCTVTVPAPADDLDGFNAGHATLSVVSVTPT
jgi:5'-nucleotidase